MNKEDIKKTQYDLIREDIDLIDKYKNTQSFDALLNDMSIHIRSAELKHQSLQSQLDQANKKLEKISEQLELYSNSTVENPDNGYVLYQNILSIIDGI